MTGATSPLLAANSLSTSDPDAAKAAAVKAAMAAAGIDSSVYSSVSFNKPLKAAAS